MNHIRYNEAIKRVMLMANNNEVQISVVLDGGEYLETRKVKFSKQANYYRVGNGSMNRHGIQAIDFLSEVMNMTKAEQLVITLIKDNIPWNSADGETYLPLTKLLDKSKETVFRKGYLILKDKGLVKRTKQGHYMINPNALLPLDTAKAKELWDKS